MTLNKKSRFLVQNALVIFIILIIWSCASIQRPTGGPRDRIPPKLLKATPANPARNFKAKVIQLDFDEYFKLSNVYQEITISPEMGKVPEYTIKQKSLVIKLKDTLQKNTTYVINFGKAIADVTEGNILKNFTYVFSTGPNIDSLNVSGVVVNPLDPAKQKDVTVMLFPLKLDSAYYRKKKPAIYTTTDTAGKFKLSNLRAGDYRIYALKETGANKIYDNDDELIGFTKNIIHLKSDTAAIHLALFKQIPAKFKVLDRRIDADGKLFYTFNKLIPNLGVRILDKELDEQKIVDFSKNADTAIIYLKTMKFDSIKVSFLDNNKPLDTITLRRSQKDTYKRKVALAYNFAGDKLKPGSDLIVTANYPIQDINTGRITMTEDSVDVDVSTVSFVRDVDDARRLTVKYRWKQNKIYSVAFNEGTFTDIYGDKNTRLVKKFTVDNPDNYAQCTLKITLPDTGQYVVQLLNETGNAVIKSDIITKSQTLIYKNLYTTRYKVKVIYDANHNGKWDTGNVLQKKQPENIWIYKKLVALRANWDVEEDIEVPKEIRYP